MTAPDAPTQRRGNRMFQMRFSMLMLIVAGVAGICAAGRYYLANRDVQTSWANQAIHNMAHGDPTERRNSADLMGNVSRDHQAAVTPWLIAGTHDPVAAVRCAAARSLTEVLISQFQGPDEMIPPLHPAAASRLIALLGDEDARVRIEAVRGLGKMQGCRRTIITGPLDKRVLTVLTLASDPKQILPAMVPGIEHDDPDLVRETLQVLQWRFLADLAPYLPALARRAKIDDPAIQPLAIATYAAAQRACKGPAIDLLACLEGAPSAEIRKAWINAIGTPLWIPGSGGPWRDADVVAEVFGRLLVTGDPEECGDLILSLRNQGIVPATTTPLLISLLEVDDPQVVEAATEALALISPPPTQALPALLLAAKKAQARWGWRITAADAIFAIDPTWAKIDELVPILDAHAREVPDPWSRGHAIEALGKIGPAAKSSVPLMIQTIRDDSELHEIAATALGKIGPEARSAVPELAILAREHVKNGAQTLSAGLAIFLIDPASDEAVSLLMHIAALRLDPRLKTNASRYNVHYQAFVPVAGPALERIREQGKAGDDRARQIADEALRRFAPADDTPTEK